MEKRACMIVIFEAEPRHLSAVRDIAYQTWPSTYKDIVSQEQIEYMLERMYDLPELQQQMTQKGHVFLIAKVEENALGFASYELNYKNEPKTKIHKIYLLPKSQGLGIGKALIDRVVAAAQLAQNQQLTLNVNRKNKAVQFYERVGFVATATEDIDIGRGYLMQDFIMTKTV